MSVTDLAGPAQYQDVTEPVAMATPLSAVEFPAVYAAELGYVWNALRRLGVQERDLEDLCHDVFVVVFRNLDVYDARRPIRPWLFGIAFRVASDYRRSARHRRELARHARASWPARRRPPTRSCCGASASGWWRARSTTLELDRRAVFVMHDIDGHVMPDIADRARHAAQHGLLAAAAGARRLRRRGQARAREAAR